MTEFSTCKQFEKTMEDQIKNKVVATKGVISGIGKAIALLLALKSARGFVDGFLMGVAAKGAAAAQQHNNF